nr:hypothetical protein [Cytophagales bacterium]
MKSLPKYIKIPLIVFFSLILFFIGAGQVYSQGFNNNEWIFGYCEGGENNYLSFGKDGRARVESLAGSVTLGRGNTAMAIDPITGEILFYSDGALIYNYLNQPIQGIIGEVGGDETERQSVAISVLDYDLSPGGARSFYLFFINRSGELEYDIVDMNEQGGAPANQPAAGAVSPGGILGAAEGAVTVIKTPQSPSYLIYFNGTDLLISRIEDQEGQFVVTQSLPVDLVPKAFVFYESSGQLLIIPEGVGEALQVADFDSDTGLLGDLRALEGTGGLAATEGAAFSPNGEIIYYSQGDQLYRIRTDGTQADTDPEEEEEEETEPELGPLALPLGHDVFRVYDVRVGPDDQLYYIYEETEGGPQLLGRVTNPDEPLLNAVVVEGDPFNGTDFCGTVFTVFTPTINIGPEATFTWEPEMPCMNNPLLLTSEISPSNYRPVSFEWEILPPLVDEEGEEIELDLSVEHLLLPREATAEQQVNVSLLVTFANGETREVTQTISFTENDLQVQFNPADTTLCEPACIDLMPLVDVQSGGGQGGQQGGGQPGIGQPGIGQPGIGQPGIGIPGIGQPGIGQPGGGQGQGGNYEYFWSNKREEGWGPEAANEVCRPGYYWVLVREVGSTCYSYAGIRIQMWDVEDQTNNIWYFGDGAGLDFNPDPDDPEAPTPRPIANPHPQNIPAGVTTISDQAGQVLFYTDGQTVWDLNGNPMQNGEDIGGDNQSAQSVTALPVSSDETLFYLFTTQRGDGGENQVKFSLVDIKGDNPDGIGNVLTKDNFLFSPSTEHSAALNSGDTTWMVFHEMGNNTFRMYPVSGEGIGQPVFNSVGGVHGFGTGVGSMKFSSDGSKLAVTYTDGNTNRLEIFDFDQTTGEMEVYALLDLGSEGDIYGLEFSSDNSRIYVSYRNGGPGVEEFFIQGLEQTDETDPDNPVTTTCPECFESATSQTEIEQCILQSRSGVPQTEGLDLGALQIGPDGQIYAAIVGSNRIGQIFAGQVCNPSTFNQDGVEPMPGTTNLGLPSFVQQSGGGIPDPSLSGPERLCLSAEEGAVGLFNGGGEPDIDLYNWTIFNEGGEIVDQFLNGGEEFQELEYTFSEVGIFTVELQVDRCGQPWEEVFRMEVEVLDSPEIILPSEISLCADAALELVAVDPDDPRLSEYIFVWENAAGLIVGDQNVLEVTEESIYTVTVAYRLPDGETMETFQTCPVSRSVFVGPAFEFEIDQDAEAVCIGDTVEFTPNTPVNGTWSIQRVGTTDRTTLPDTLQLTLNTGMLDGPGEYELFFLTADPLNSACPIERSTTLTVNPPADFAVLATSPAQSCEIPDGFVRIEAITRLDSLVMEETGLVILNLEIGASHLFDGLEPGTYTFTGYSGGCPSSQLAIIENASPPDDVAYTVVAEDPVCDPSGIATDGSIRITFTNGPASGSYEIISFTSGERFTADFTSQPEIVVDLPVGAYTVEVSNLGGCALPTPETVEISDIVEQIPVELSSPNFCGEATISTITASGELASVDIISWYREVAGEFVQIPGQIGAIIEVAEPGNYQVRLFNGAGCEIGSQVIEVTQSTSLPPQLAPSYTICGAEDDLATLNAGPYQAFEWILNEEVLSRENQFTPTLPGEYTLRVWDEQGCEFETEFVIEEECDVNVTFPNAIIPLDPTRGFVIYTTGPIDKLGVHIFNRWGELIYYCEQSNPAENTSLCVWDGVVNGKKVPVGTYPVVVKFSNEAQGIERTLKKAIVVID